MQMIVLTLMNVRKVDVVDVLTGRGASSVLVMTDTGLTLQRLMSVIVGIFKSLLTCFGKKVKIVSFLRHVIFMNECNAF